MNFRVGLVGAGYWARETHAPAISKTAGVEFASLFARNAEAAAALAAHYGATPFADFDDFLASVDIVEFAVPPNIQSKLALRAAEQGKHLLLEKPIAFDAESAFAIADAVSDSEVNSVVFFTARFQPEIEAWLNDAAKLHWNAGRARWVTSAMRETGSPWASSEWRIQRGGLWDIGPHALALMLPLLGKVSDVFVKPTDSQIVECLFEHSTGALSALTVTIHAPEGTDVVDFNLWGDSGRTSMPATAVNPQLSLVRALGSLTSGIGKPPSHNPCDADFGAVVVETLCRIQNAVDSTARQA